MSWIDILPWIYISFQTIVTLIVSILGAKYIQNEFSLQKNRAKQELQIKIQQQTNSDNINANKYNVDNKHTFIDDNKDTTEEIQKTNDNDHESTEEKEESEKYAMVTKMGFCKLWFKMVWKMRSVYGSFAVHAFDTLTDI
eukprot:301611_1